MYGEAERQLMKLDCKLPGEEFGGTQLLLGTNTEQAAAGHGVALAQ